MQQMGTLSFLFVLSSTLSVGFSGLIFSLRQLQPKFPFTCSDVKTRFPDLFVSRESIQNMNSERQFQETFMIDRVRERFSFPGTCPRRNVYSQKMLSTCDWSESSRRNLIEPCCETKLSITIPDTVTSVFSGQASQVVHLSSSYQLLHEAKCAKPKSQCSTGRCELAYRIQWVLVQQRSEQAFVPVSVGNHCYCSFQ